MGRHPNPQPERTATMIALRESGLSLEEIGDRFGLTRERVRQLLAPHEIKVGVECQGCGKLFESNTVSALHCDECKKCAGCGRRLDYRVVGVKNFHEKCDPEYSPVGKPTVRSVDAGVYQRFYKDGRTYGKPYTYIEGEYKQHESIEDAIAYRKKKGFNGDGRSNQRPREVRDEASRLWRERVPSRYATTPPE